MKTEAEREDEAYALLCDLVERASNGEYVNEAAVLEQLKALLAPAHP